MTGDTDLPLIKARQAETQLVQAEVLRLQDIEAEAQKIIAAARAQADAILAEARTQAEKLKAEARKTGAETGRAEGLKAGFEAGRKQAFEQAVTDFAGKHAAVVKAFSAAIEQFESHRRSLQSDLERDAVALAAAIANRVAKLAVEVDPACLTGNLREALQLIVNRNRLELRLHPQDLEHARQFAHDLLPVQEFETLTFVADEAVAPGGAVLRTPAGQVDATIETQWARILDEILAGWREHWLLAPTILQGADTETGFVEIVQQDQVRGQDAPVDAAEGQGAILEEIDPREVEEIDRNDAAR